MTMKMQTMARSVARFLRDMPWPWMAAMFFAFSLINLAVAGGVVFALNLGIALGWGASMVVAKRRGWIGGR